MYVWHLEENNAKKLKHGKKLKKITSNNLLKLQYDARETVDSETLTGLRRVLSMSEAYIYSPSGGDFCYLPEEKFVLLQIHFWN